MARRRINKGEAAAAAEQIVPDLTREEAPPHEGAADGGAAGEDWLDDPLTPGGATRRAEERDEEPVVTRRETSSSGWGAVIDDVYRIDVESTYQRLKAELSLGESATVYGEVLAALDRADANTLDALRLARLAKLEDERVAHTIAERLEVLRTSAKQELEKEVAESYDEKLKKTTKKAPTLQDVEDKMIANWPDEVGSLRRRKEEMHGTLRVMEGLHDAWVSRAQSLRKIMERVAPVRSA